MLLPHGRLTLAPAPLPARPATWHARPPARHGHRCATALLAMAAVTRRARKVAVVGGGPAGLAAAWWFLWWVLWWFHGIFVGVERDSYIMGVFFGLCSGI